MIERFVWGKSAMKDVDKKDCSDEKPSLTPGGHEDETCWE